MAWLTSPEEQAKSRRRAKEWILPLANDLSKKIGKPRGEIKIASVGCGNGEDAILLREEGYDAYGIDPSLRDDLKAREFFIEAGADHIPFPDETFDILFFLEVFEHVGVKPGAFTDMGPAYRQERQKAAAELLRVLKTGGYVILATPNRYFPVDEHAANAKGQQSLRFHGVFDKFTLSYFEIKGYFSKVADCRFEFLPATGYYAFQRIERMFGARLLGAMETYLDLCSSKLIGPSFLNPHLFLKITKLANV